MENGTVSRIAPSVEVTAWERDPGTVVEIAIGRPMDAEQMAELARLTSITVKMLLKLAKVGGVS